MLEGEKRTTFHEKMGKRLTELKQKIKKFIKKFFKRS